jgi:hypothetical protein
LIKKTKGVKQGKLPRFNILETINLKTMDSEEGDYYYEK